MSYDLAVRTWAGKKLGIPADTIKSVSIESDAGWVGTDITAGDPSECIVQATLMNGKTVQILDLIDHDNGHMYAKRSWDFVDLLTEILG